MNIRSTETDRLFMELLRRFGLGEAYFQALLNTENHSCAKHAADGIRRAAEGAEDFKSPAVIK